MRDTGEPLSIAVLDWYDQNARDLPWRVPPALSRQGQMPDPYRVWLSEIMLQQTTVAAVKDYFTRFLSRWPDVQSLASAEDADVMAEWAGLGYYARARNLLKCARVVSTDLNGVFPDQHDALLKLPGIGPYTAAAIAAIAFGRSEAVVDGNVERVMARVFAITTPLPAAKPEMKVSAAKLTPSERAGDYAQAVMDLGATICTPRNPACGICPVAAHCQARLDGIAVQLPARSPKKAKPIRRGVVYVAQRSDGAYLVERRPDKGLLGGMLGWPGSDWGDDPIATPPMAAAWRAVAGEVRHTFTHFHLILEVQIAQVPLEATPECGHFLPKPAFRPGDMPTVMRKVYDLVSHGALGF